MDEQTTSLLFAKLGDLLSHPLTTAIGLALGAWGIVISLRARARVEAVFVTRYRQWLGSASKYDGLSISYRGEKVDRIGSTDLILWNAGNKTIRSEDFSPSDPLRVVISGEGQVFDIEMGKSQPESLPLHLTFEAVETGNTAGPRVALLRFEFLEPKEGARVRVIHDGGSAMNVSLAGRLAGGGPFKRYSESDFGSLFNSVWGKIWTVQLLLLLGTPGGMCVYRIVTGTATGWHWAFSFLIAYWIAIPYVLSSRIKPKGLF